MNFQRDEMNSNKNQLGVNLGDSSKSKKLVPLVNLDSYAQKSTSIFEPTNLCIQSNDFKEMQLRERNNCLKYSDTIKTIKAPRKNMFKEIVGSEFGSDRSSSNDSALNFVSKIRRQKFSNGKQNLQSFYETTRDFASPQTTTDKNFNTTRISKARYESNFKTQYDSPSKFNNTMGGQNREFENSIREYIEEEKSYLGRVNSTSKERLEGSVHYVRNSMRLPSLESIFKNSPNKKKSLLEKQVELEKTQKVIQTKKNLKKCQAKITEKKPVNKKNPIRKISETQKNQKNINKKNKPNFTEDNKKMDSHEIMPKNTQIESSNSNLNQYMANPKIESKISKNIYATTIDIPKANNNNNVSEVNSPKNANINNNNTRQQMQRRDIDRNLIQSYDFTHYFTNNRKKTTSRKRGEDNPRNKNVLLNTEIRPRKDMIEPIKINKNLKRLNPNLEVENNRTDTSYNQEYEGVNNNRMSYRSYQPYKHEILKKKEKFPNLLNQERTGKDNEQNTQISDIVSKDDNINIIESFQHNTFPSNMKNSQEIKKSISNNVLPEMAESKNIPILNNYCEAELFSQKKRQSTNLLKQSDKHIENNSNNVIDLIKSVATERIEVKKLTQSFATSRIGRKMNQENEETFSQKLPKKNPESNANLITGKSLDTKSVAEAFAQRFSTKLKMENLPGNDSFIKISMKSPVSHRDSISKTHFDRPDKQELRRRRMNYGNKSQRNKCYVSMPKFSTDMFYSRETQYCQTPTTHNKEFLKDATERTNANNSSMCTYTKNEPSVEVLDRLGRGIRPQVTKKEMYEINKRGLQRQPENRKKDQDIEKKKLLLERKEKVKQLDQRCRKNVIKKSYK